MRTTILLITLLLGFLGVVRPACGQTTNRADVYRDAFAQYDKWRLSNGEKLSLLKDYAANPQAPLTADVRAALQEVGPILSLVRQASRAETLDWGIEYSLGPGTLLPHLAPMRNLGMLAVADAKVNLADGNVRSAAELFSLSLGMSNDATSDPVIINTLVGAAMYRANAAALQQAIGEGALDQASGRALLESLQSMISADPLGFVASIDGERNVFLGWLQAEYQVEGGREQMLNDVGQWFLDGEAGFDARSAVDSMTDAQFNLQFDMLGLAYERMQSAARMQDFQQMKAEFEEIERLAGQGAFGMLARLAMPSLTKYVESILKTYQSMSDLMSDLETIAASPEGVLSLRNAALWYLQAIEQERKLASGVRGQIDALCDHANDAEEDAPTIDAEALRRAMEPIVAILLEAADIDQCNFDLLDDWNRRGMLAGLEHPPGMVRCARVLAAEARLRFETESAESQLAAAERSAAIFRMIEHLQRDANLPSSQACCEMAELGSRVVFDAAADGKLSKSVRDAIEPRFRSMTMSGGMGVEGVLRHYPAATTGWLLQWRVRGEDRQSTIAAFDEIRQMLKPDVMFDFEPFSTVQRFRDSLTQLDGLLREAARSASDRGNVRHALHAALATHQANEPAWVSDWIVRPLLELLDREENVAEALNDARVLLQHSHQ